MKNTMNTMMNTMQMVDEFRAVMHGLENIGDEVCGSIHKFRLVDFEGLTRCKRIVKVYDKSGAIGTIKWYYDRGGWYVPGIYENVLGWEEIGIAYFGRYGDLRESSYEKRKEGSLKECSECKRDNDLHVYLNGRLDPDTGKMEYWETPIVYKMKY